MRYAPYRSGKPWRSAPPSSPLPGQRHVLKPYIWFGWLFPVIRALAPGAAGTVREIARAMIAVTQRGTPKPVLEVKDIRALAA